MIPSAASRRATIAAAIAFGIATSAWAKSPVFEHPNQTTKLECPESKSEGGVSEDLRDVQPPVALYEPNPKYSKEARKAKFSGKVVVSLIVDKDGKPRNVHVVQSAGMGLDENAVKTVEKYRFKPATKNGIPVAVYINVDFNFQIGN